VFATRGWRSEGGVAWLVERSYVFWPDVTHRIIDQVYCTLVQLGCLTSEGGKREAKCLTWAGTVGVPLA
jgi:hypothetical protein